MKIAVGMSGGVDSSVTAYLLKQQGYDVVGVTMRIWSDRNYNPATNKGRNVVSSRHACFGPGEEEEVKQASEVCEKLGIPHEVFDISNAYENTILDYFKRSYLSGKTPNPCVYCNCKMKFGILSSLADRNYRVDAFATGHYARLESSPGCRRVLLRQARDESKDQSYFLYRLNQTQFRKALFPLGEYFKETVREIARKADIPAYDLPESQDFYDGDYGELIGKKEEPGEIVDLQGTVLGTHRGIWKYTVGQRRGLGISSSVPLYVTEIDPDRNRIIVAPRKESTRKSFLAEKFNWVSIEGLENPRYITVKVRSSSRPLRCSAQQLDEETVRVLLEQPHAGIAAGQSAVLYDGDLVLGGGTIEYE